MKASALPTYQFIEHLKELPFVRNITLFGSRARGDHSEMSDIDLAIDCPAAQSSDWLSVLKILDEADTLLKVDCVRIQDIDQTLKEKIAEEGIIIYERKTDPKN